ncbi:MAG: radical SAM protein, partial [Desulfobacteraceae bacterium]|nr:radical SAM protein [Desulfobacteraceae bacterium]
WNKCTFCSIYKNRKFSLRSLEDIIKDIDLLHTYIKGIMQSPDITLSFNTKKINNLFSRFDIQDRAAFNTALQWHSTGMKSIFLQDANSLIMKPEDLISVLTHIKERFPLVKRITSYARSHTISRISSENMKKFAEAGLNRIHIGMESGSDRVLKRIKKGVDKQDHIKAGLRVKEAGIELSEYVMPGLGGVELSIENALETAEALNMINPDFIRIRSLALPPRAPLAQQHENGEFEKCTDLMMAKELKLFLENLYNIDSYIKSDHILNLIETIDGKMPEDKERLISIMDSFLDMDPEQQVQYQIGRRMGLFRGPADMADTQLLNQVKETCGSHGITPSNVDAVIDDLMKRFV